MRGRKVKSRDCALASDLVRLRANVETEPTKQQKMQDPGETGWDT